MFEKWSFGAGQWHSGAAPTVHRYPAEPDLLDPGAGARSVDDEVGELQQPLTGETFDELRKRMHR
ncbi:hypothetical protein PA7_42210 [Pseudonocardia asaccharolytica DSM 44247 = NBRC 16224]|uniref:Uncharacterized protein n=1 Tax=Pseudonocardia asaccharolytica DSM 44247 = NBRC 16224 TaxID=1123024 RepID=A0A511D9S2_9PSEU|nr:hypothetical protein PA7_42210 [Pseudonocardia asaccharolytica DSM 44247 = NBRC 16224]